MKKNKKQRKRIAKLTAKDISSCKFFAMEGRQMNAHKVEIKFQRGYNVVATVVFIYDEPHKQTIIRWFNRQYYTLRFGAKEAKPCNMTLAMWKSING